MRFIYGAPGLLQDDGAGGFFADWNVAADNFGFTQSEVEDTVSSALNDSRGWGPVPPGITFRHVGDSSRAAGTVTYKVVESIPVSPGTGGVNPWGVTIPGGYDSVYIPTQPNTWVLIEAAHFADLGITNHEGAHAWFGATHSPQGADSLMEPYEDPGTEWPSETDLAQVEAWLATAPEDHADHDRPQGEGGNVHWFPGNLPSYITRFPVPSGCESRLTASVLGPARVALQALYHEDYSELLAGNGRRFARGLDCYQHGVFFSPWRNAPTGELYVGIAAQVDDDADLVDLIIGLAEVQIR